MINCSSFGYLLQLSLSLLMLISSLRAAPECSARYGTSLRAADCLEAIEDLPRTDAVSESLLSLFTDTNTNPRYRIPYTTSSRNGACNLGVDWATPWETQTLVRWSQIHIAALVLVHQCVSVGNPHPGWGGSQIVAATGGVLKVVIWEEMEDDYEDDYEAGFRVQVAQTTEELQDVPPSITYASRVIATFTTELLQDVGSNMMRTSLVAPTLTTEVLQEVGSSTTRTLRVVPTSTTEGRHDVSRILSILATNV